jgi:hypothetical protein
MAISNKILESFFKPINYDVIRNPNSRISPNFGFKKGNLITFNYSFWKNDPYPLIIISKDSTYGVGKLRGVNLHRLTFNSIRELINNCKNPNFSYLNNIKNRTNLEGAYRSYTWSGVRQVKVLNHEFLLNIISTVRNFDPAEVAIIRKNVQEQIREKINPKASELSARTLNTSKQAVQQSSTIPPLKSTGTVAPISSNTEKT